MTLQRRLQSFWLQIVSFSRLTWISEGDEKPKYFNLGMVGIIVGMILLQTLGGVVFGMNAMVIVVCVIALVQKDGFVFFRDFWLPVVLMYFYEVTRANAFIWSQEFGFYLFVEEIIRLEEAVFFFLQDIPPVALQNWIDPDVTNPQLYDYFFVIFYGLFFWAWAILALVLWRFRRAFYKPYVYGLIAFSLTSVVIFFLFPTAPPWYASEVGLIEPVERVLWEFEYIPGVELNATQEVGQNDFAAIPSLHAGWMMYAALWCIVAFGRKYWWVISAPLIVAFATWYGAEHYVIDSLIGFAMAAVFFILFLRVVNKKT